MAIDRVVLHGGRASILYGWRPAAVLTWWRVVGTKAPDRWTLTGEIHWSDGPSCRKKGLIFTAPRDTSNGSGMWAFGIESLEIAANGRLQARLGPPEQ